MATKQDMINASSWDGTLSYVEFYTAAFAFAESWNKFNSTLPQWIWFNSPKPPWISSNQVDGYLSTENVVLPKFSEIDYHEGDKLEKEEFSSLEEDEFTDSASLVQYQGDGVHCYDFHILYSPSYRVPVLYFRAYSNDGQPLALNDIKEDMPPNSMEVLTKSKWTYITQEEHPQLNRPWYKLHPCGTGEWMKLLLTNEASAEGGIAVEKYLISWFSVVGQVFGLKTPFEMLNNSSL